MKQRVGSTEDTTGFFSQKMSKAVLEYQEETKFYGSEQIYNKYAKIEKELFIFQKIL